MAAAAIDKCKPCTWIYGKYVCVWDLLCIHNTHTQYSYTIMFVYEYWLWVLYSMFVYEYWLWVLYSYSECVWSLYEFCMGVYEYVCECACALCEQVCTRLQFDNPWGLLVTTFPTSAAGLRCSLYPGPQLRTKLSGYTYLEAGRATSVWRQAKVIARLRPSPGQAVCIDIQSKIIGYYLHQFL